MFRRDIAAVVVYIINIEINFSMEILSDVATNIYNVVVDVVDARYFFESGWELIGRRRGFILWRGGGGAGAKLN
jgi:hypothetical protein